MVKFGQRWLYSGKVDVFGQSGCIRIKTCCSRAKWLYSDKTGCIREKALVFGKKWLYSAKWLYSGKLVEIGQSCCIRAKVVL